MSESEIQDFVLQYLQTHRKGFFWRNNTTGVWDPVRKVFRKNNNLKGVSDIIGVMNGKAIFIECKSTIGKLSKDQKIFREMVEKNGGIFYVANDINNFINWYKQLCAS